MRLFRRRAVARGDEPPPDIAEWLAYDETLAGGYIFTADPQAPPMTLMAPLVTRSTTSEAVFRHSVLVRKTLCGSGR